MPQPNILFLFSDQQRWDTLGCYQQPSGCCCQPPNTTPNLDRMAAEGVRFEHAFTCQPVCGPARSCLQTGLYATQNRCPTNHCMLPLDSTTIAHHLSAAGYEVGYIGKWHLSAFGPRGGPDDFRERPVPTERRGGYKDFWLASDTLEYTSHSYDGHMFDGDGNRRDFPEGRYRVDAQTDWVIEYLETRDGKRPFFLFASYIEPHHQNDHERHEGPRGSKERFRDFVVPGDLVGTEGDWREEYPDYLGCVASLDENVGRIRATLERLGLAENTLVIYTSDHGSHFRTRNAEYKRSPHDGCIRVPLVMSGPGISGGLAPKELVSLIDLPPTILTAAGVTPPEVMRGSPVQRVVAGDAAGWQDDVFVQISESQCGRAIRTRRWKYSVVAPGKTGHDASSDLYVEEYLYDLEADPHERTNRVDDPSLADVRAEMAARLKRRMAHAGEAEPVVLSRREFEAGGVPQAG